MPNKKNALCYILPEYNPETDSHYRYLYDFISLLKTKYELFLLVEKKRFFDDHFPGVEHIYVQKFSFLPLRILENFLVILFIRFFYCRKFYVHYSYVSAVNASLVARFTNGRVWYWNCGMPWLFSRDLLSQLLLKITLKTVNYLVTGSPSLIPGYSQNYGVSQDRIKIMPNWTDSARFNPQLSVSQLRHKWKIPQDKKIVLFVHHLSPRKGADRLSTIARGLGNGILVVAAGDGPSKQKLNLEISAGRVTNLLLLGRISNNEIPELMKLSDIFIMPSREEGFPHVLLESMVSSLPYVASDIGGVRGITPPVLRTYLVLPDDDCGFIAKCRLLLAANHDNIRRVIHRHGEKYTLSNSFNEFNKIIHE